MELETEISSTLWAIGPREGLLVIDWFSRHPRNTVGHTSTPFFSQWRAAATDSFQGVPSFTSLPSPVCYSFICSSLLTLKPPSIMLAACSSLLSLSVFLLTLLSSSSSDVIICYPVFPRDTKYAVCDEQCSVFSSVILLRDTALHCTYGWRRLAAVALLQAACSSLIRPVRAPGAVFFC